MKGGDKKAFKKKGGKLRKRERQAGRKAKGGKLGGGREREASWDDR